MPAAVPRYRGPLRAAILDWAGTTVDFGSQAPVAVLLSIFESRSVPVTAAEARKPMGLHKRDHIRAICEMPEVRERWIARHGSAPSETDVEALFAAFTPRLLQSIASHSGVIPGVPEAVAAMRARGMRIGTTTGYTRIMLDEVIPRAAQQGYSPDVSVCPEEAGGGRPLPWMCYRNAMCLQIYPLQACVKIGDTPVDIHEGLNAGMWTIGVAATGNETGLPERELAALSESDRRALVTSAGERLLTAGAHYVVDSIADVEPVLDQIGLRLRDGEVP